MAAEKVNFVKANTPAGKVTAIRAPLARQTTVNYSRSGAGQAAATPSNQIPAVLAKNARQTHL